MAEPSPPRSETLNRNCFCVTLDRDALRDALQAEARDQRFWEKFISPRAHLFSATPVFLSATELSSMEAVVRAIEEVVQFKPYQAAALSQAPEVALHDHGPAGALMGYDFHLGTDGPRLIEINTNAGGAFLNALLARAHRACCAGQESVPTPDPVTFDEAVVRMFRNEWKRQRGAGQPGRIAITDDNPGEQYLYPEFVLAREVLTGHGMETVIGDASHLRYVGGRLLLDDQAIDLVYNRVTDFAFDHPEHVALLNAYRDGAVVVTPNPHNHALLADKHNLVLLSDPAVLEAWNVPQSLQQQLRAVPKTVLVDPNNADGLWSDRKNLFFKPVAGHGGKAVYRGDKVTKRVWEGITQGGYVAQALVRPGERMIKVDGVPEIRKVDFRLYTYEGRTLLSAARVYQGQTTNFRTPGGGFAPVFVI